MKRSPFRKAICAGLVLALLGPSLPSSASGPSFNITLFTLTSHPDLPLEPFAQGQLGILLPTYRRTYLFAAYRILIGAGFNPAEQTELLSLWKERLAGETYISDEDLIKPWIDARAKIPGIKDISPALRLYRQALQFEEYLNCPADAFLNASATLQQRIKAWGLQSPDIKSWVDAQDQVFSNCSEGKSIPSEATAGSSPLLQADRRYQIASAYFYAGEWEPAAALFKQIGAEKSSPWKSIAPYLYARTLVRKGTVQAQGVPMDRASLLQASETLKLLLQDDSRSAYHAAARHLLSLIQAKLAPEERLGELAHLLLTKNNAGKLRNDLADYVFLLAHADPTLVNRTASDDLTDWIKTFQTINSGGFPHALEEWRRTHRVVWLAAAITGCPLRDPSAPELMRGAQAVASESPAYLTLLFHRLRLESQIEKANARHDLDTFLATPHPELRSSSRNLFLALNLRLSQNFTEFLHASLRLPVCITTEDDDQEFTRDDKTLEGLHGSPLWDSDAVDILNKKVPLYRLVEAAQSPVIPSLLQRRLAEIAWVRASVLKDRGALTTLTPLLSSLEPSWKNFFANISAHSDEERHFESILFLLQNPGLNADLEAGLGRRGLEPRQQIDDFRDNWWCAPGQREYMESPSPAMAFNFATLGPLEFLTDDEKRLAEKERVTMRASGAAPNFLAKETLLWLNQNSKDPRVAEALALAVRATRYGCTDVQTSHWSKEAFRALRHAFPDSPWTRKTKHYY